MREDSDMRKTRDSTLERKGYVTVKEAAERCQQAQSTVYRWLDTGAVEGLQVGRSRYVKLASLVEFIGKDAAKLLGLG